MIPYQLELIDTDESFDRLEPRLAAASAVAIDIETSNWWRPAEERVEIIQIGFRESDHLRVAICDPLAGLNPERLRRMLELGLQTKVMHNASYDAVRIARHFGIHTSPIHDTMLAARRAGEKGCSLKALVHRHLGISIDKTEQRGDWSRRPLNGEQLNYAALDAVFTLLIYELQVARSQFGDYHLRTPPQPIPAQAIPDSGPDQRQNPVASGVTPLGRAIIAIVSKFPSRYSTRQLAASMSDHRSGMLGWIIDQTVGSHTFIDQRMVDQEIETLLRMRLLGLDRDDRLRPSPLA